MNKQYDYKGILIGSNVEKTEEELRDLVEFVEGINNRKNLETHSFEIFEKDGEITIYY